MNTYHVSKVRRSVTLGLVLLGLGLMATANAVSAGAIVDHPDELTFPDLDYQPPEPGPLRHTLDCGAVAYIAENPEVPTFDLAVLIRTGSIYEPREKAGLASMTAHLMRNGSTETMTASEIDERLAYLAGSISIGIGETQGNARLFCLSKDMDEGLEILLSVLRMPTFAQAALDRHRADILSELEERNASTSAIESREWAFLLYGDHPSTNSLRQTAQSVNSVTREDLIAFHAKYFFPRNFIFAVAGDFKTADVIDKLNRMLAGWPDRELALPAIPDAIDDPRPGVYMIRKEDVNQSRIRIGHLGVKRDIPDQYALMIMNDILGGGGFSSRITRRVRSDEGLAYSTGSRFDRPVLYPGTFEAYFQTKHETAAFGTRLIVDEIKRIRTEKCDEEPIEVSKASMIGRLVNPFSSKSSIVNTFADDEYTNRPDGYWRDYRKNIESVTADDVLAAAQKHLHPEKLVYLLVGDPEAAEAGSDRHEEHFSDFGETTILPLRDPVTLEVR